MKERGTSIGTTQEEAERLAPDIVSGITSKLILFPQSTALSEMEVELARAARGGRTPYRRKWKKDEEGQRIR